MSSFIDAVLNEQRRKMNKRIIICGPAASGKDFLKTKFGNQGFELDISYTTRPIREGEENGVDYHFIIDTEFFDKYYNFYEYAQHGKYYYATGTYEWETFDIFIMETEGISEIIPEDRKNCFIIYLNPPQSIREKRLKEIRGWNDENIAHRAKMDNEKFKDFKDYDMKITDPNF